MESARKFVKVRLEPLEALALAAIIPKEGGHSLILELRAGLLECAKDGQESEIHLPDFVVSELRKTLARRYRAFAASVQENEGPEGDLGVDLWDVVRAHRSLAKKLSDATETEVTT